MKFFIGYFRKCDLLTMLGTALAFCGIYFACLQHFTIAIFCLVLCGICDSFDGPLARKYEYNKSQKEYGVQLDTVSDVICFGVFPALLTVLMSNQSKIVLLFCIFYLLCGVIRLAYFNMLYVTKTGKNGEYIGLPITTIALVYPIIFLILRFINYSLIGKVMPFILLIMGFLFILKFKINKPDIPKITRKIFNKYTVNLVFFPMFLIFGSDLVYALNNNALIAAISHSINNVISYPLAFIYLYLLVVLIYSFINLLFKRSIWAKIILVILFGIFLLVNDIKFHIMGIPIELSDVNYLNPDNIKMMGNATSTIGNWIFVNILKIIIFVLFGLVFIIKDKNMVLDFNSKKKRMIISIVCVVIFIFQFLIITKWNNVIIKGIYHTSKSELNEFYSAADFSDEFGLIQGIIISDVSKKASEPDGYDSKEVVKLLNDASNNKSKINWGKANVVFILSESFSDLQNVDEIKFDKELMPEIKNFEKSDNSMVFDLLVPTFGGVSVNTEFEILTGASLSFWNSGFIPFTQYYNDYSGEVAPNIIAEFNNNGYTTMYLTPWGDTSYNSRRNYTWFGTDELIYDVNLSGENKGDYYSDKSLMEDIYNQLKDTSVDNYKFIMSASGQNHFPYNKGKYDKYDINVVKSSFNKSSTEILKNYAQGVYDASKELYNLYKMIQKLDVPTIVVFFGDHLPYTVDNGGFNSYLSSNYFNTDDKTLNNLRKYTTKAVIFSNYEIECEDIDYLNASFLGAYVLNNMDLNISNYFKYLDSVRKVVPAFNRDGVVNDKKITKFSDVNTNIMSVINNYKYVQHGSFYEFIK